MFQLTLDGKRAVIKKGTSIKLTRENPFFTQSGDFTLDITLPLAGCPENQEIFGALQRHDSQEARTITRLNFDLVADTLHIAGRARITQSTETEVKVQLLGGSSSLNVDATDEEGNDLYIDELDLGYAYDDTEFAAWYELHQSEPEVKDNGGETLGRFLQGFPIMYMMQEIVPSISVDKRVAYQRGTPEQTRFVTFPVYSKDNEIMANYHCLDYSRVTDLQWSLDSDINRGSEPLDLLGYSRFACQPYLLEALRRVLLALGYTADVSALANDWRTNVFIASHSRSCLVAKALPHWTVSEFITEVRNFFGSYLEVNGATATLLNNESVVTSGNIVYPNSIVRSHTIEFSKAGDSSSSRTIADGNVEYAVDNEDSILHLPEEVWANAIIKVFANESIMVAWINENVYTDSQKEASKYLFCDSETGRVYAHLYDSDLQTYTLSNVDVCPSLIRPDQFSATGRAADVTLNIVPASLQVTYTGIRDAGTGFHDSTLRFYCIQTDDKVSPADEETYSVAAALQGGENTTVEDKSSTMYVAYNNGSTAYCEYTYPESGSIFLPMPVGIGFYKSGDTGLYSPILYQPLASIANIFLLSNQQYAPKASQEIGLDSTITMRIQYTDDLTNPMDIFVIAGRRYVCRKIEMTIDERGLQPLKTAYLSPLDA